MTDLAEAKHELLEAEDAKARAYLKAMDENLRQLYQTPIPSREACTAVHTQLAVASRLVRAFRTWPVFDPKALGMMKRQTIAIPVRQQPGRTFTMELNVPSLACADAGCSMDFEPGNPVGYLTRDISFQYPLKLSEDNGVQLEEKTGERFGNYVRAHAPLIPDPLASVYRHAVGACDEVKVVWEAQWLPRPVADPLIVGIVGDYCFLVAQWDASKLESYVASELCRDA